MRKRWGKHGPLSIISAHMHAQTMTTPIITWQPSTSISSGAVGCVLGMSVDTCQRSGNMFSPTTKRALGSGSHLSHRKDKGSKSELSSDGVLSDEEEVNRRVQGGVLWQMVQFLC